MTIRAEPVLDERALLGEGALWHPELRELLWIDIPGKKVHRYDPAAGTNRSFSLDRMPGTIVPRRAGGAVVALQDGLYSFDLETGATRLLAPVEADVDDTRFNDGKCDPAGRFWAGTMGMGRKNAGTLYRVDPDLSVHAMLSPVSTSNGLVWTVDNTTMYYVDSPTFRIDAFDYDLETGAVSNRRGVVSVPPEAGVADGIWLDERGNIWAAHFRGGCVRCWDPRNGKLVETVEVPGAKNVTSCAFGGPDRDVLYITTASRGLDEKALKEQPNAGLLFAARPGVRGVAAHYFAG